jgi:hypothetical protein
MLIHCWFSPSKFFLATIHIHARLDVNCVYRCEETLGKNMYTLRRSTVRDGGRDSQISPVSYGPMQSSCASTVFSGSYCSTNKNRSIVFYKTI